jgi:hypothetical protein
MFYHGRNMTSFEKQLLAVQSATRVMRESPALYDALSTLRSVKHIYEGLLTHDTAAVEAELDRLFLPHVEEVAEEINHERNNLDI